MEGFNNINLLKETKIPFVEIQDDLFLSNFYSYYEQEKLQLILTVKCSISEIYIYIYTYCFPSPLSQTSSQGCKCFLFFRISYFFNACAHSPF